MRGVPQAFTAAIRGMRAPRGRTKRRTLRQPGQRQRRTTQNIRSAARMRGLRPDAWKAAICCLSTTFSMTRSRRVRRAPRRKPRTSGSTNDGACPGAGGWSSVPNDRRDDGPSLVSRTAGCVLRHHKEPAKRVQHLGTRPRVEGLELRVRERSGARFVEDRLAAVEDDHVVTQVGDGLEVVRDDQDDVLVSLGGG